MNYLIKNNKLDSWVKEVAALCLPERIHWCDGSQGEYNQLMELMVSEGKAIPINKRPNSFLFRSDPQDVARVESRTFIGTRERESAGVTNNWIQVDELKKTMTELYRGCMRGRTMYVIPFSMSPLHSPMMKLAVEITDSAYVACNMDIMTRVGKGVMDLLNQGEDFIECLHSVGYPLEKGQPDIPWPCAPLDKKYISHFPEENAIWSYGSGYGGNALLGKKCLSLRLASVIAQREGWMAEHMLILRLISPQGKKYHVCAAFPSASGKTNLAMIKPTLPGWKAETLGDDIAWMKLGDDNRLYAINPEAGFFGVAPGTSFKSNPAAMELIKENTIFTNCALTDDGDIWWEGMGPAPDHLIDWKGRNWTPSSHEPAAHPNARYTARASACPIISADWEYPGGVPVDIFMFGGRRSTVVPLVTEAFDWDHGVFMGATAASEPTSAVQDKLDIRYDPFAMLPFCGYNMADYFQHQFEMGDKMGDRAPRIFLVNWFRKSPDGKWLWPGFGDNIRVLAWMCQRIEGKAAARTTPIGCLPEAGDLDLTGLSLPQNNLEQLLSVDKAAWRNELSMMEKFFSRFDGRLPSRLVGQLTNLKDRLS